MIKRYDDFNYYFETVGLLFDSSEFESYKDSIISELNKMGIAGENVYDTHFSKWEHVILEFNKNKIIDKNYDFYFKKSINEPNFCLFIAVLVGEHFEEFQSKKLSKESLQHIILNLIEIIANDDSESSILSTQDFYDYLLRLDFTESEKWKVFSFYQNPQKYIKELMDIITLNLEVTKSVYENNDINKYILKLDMINNETSKDVPLLKVSAGLPIRPTFIHPLIVMMSETQLYFGVLYFDVFENDKWSNELDNNLLIKFKVLSDKSKLQILILLKKKDMYSLELAKELDLSTGTISHHMSALLQAGFVTVEKQSGKVYYQVNKEEILIFIQKINNLLI